MDGKQDEPVHSTRFFWWEASGLTRRFTRLIYRGTEENCNRTLGIRVPGGVLFVLIERHVRQHPCKRCTNMAWDERTMAVWKKCE